MHTYDTPEWRDRGEIEVTLSRIACGRALFAIGVAATLVAGPADARRGGSFGSRGSHTYYSPASTRLSPGYVAPVSRTMTARPSAASPSYAPQYAPANRPRFGFGGGLLTGLVTGGLIGAMFGHHGWGGGYGGGMGGGGGFLALLLQIAVLGGIAWLVMRLFRGRGASASQPPFAQSGFASDGYRPGFGAAAPSPEPSISLTSADQQSFERLLVELQDAFGHEDYARLRAITTPEVMSYLAEELSDNATHGRRNEVTGTRLLDGEVSEAWNEGDADYATIVMRYESTDVMRDRATNAVLPGSGTTPTETTELWTFVRPAGAWSGWKVSAIQES